MFSHDEAHITEKETYRHVILVYSSNMKTDAHMYKDLNGNLYHVSYSFLFSYFDFCLNQMLKFEIIR